MHKTYYNLGNTFSKDLSIELQESPESLNKTPVESIHSIALSPSR
jgi:hypothetical protein